MAKGLLFWTSFSRHIHIKQVLPPQCYRQEERRLTRLTSKTEKDNAGLSCGFEHGPKLQKLAWTDRTKLWLSQCKVWSQSNHWSEKQQTSFLHTHWFQGLWWSLRILYLLVCQVSITVGHLGLCFHFYVTSFKRQLTPFICWLISPLNNRISHFNHPKLNNRFPLTRSEKSQCQRFFFFWPWSQSQPVTLHRLSCSMWIKKKKILTKSYYFTS